MPETSLIYFFAAVCYHNCFMCTYKHPIVAVNFENRDWYLDSCLMLGIKRCYEAKLEESKKASSH